MFNEDPHCRRCGVQMWLPQSNDRLATKNLTKEQWETLATIAHRFSRLTDERYTEPGTKKKYELICQKCNQLEAKEEIQKLPIEEQWERSKAYPQGHIMAIANQQNKHSHEKINLSKR